MTKAKIALRVLLLVCYFLPFVFFHTTCVGPSFKAAFSHNEADQNEAEARWFIHLTDSVKHAAEMPKKPVPDSVNAAEADAPPIVIPKEFAKEHVRLDTHAHHGFLDKVGQLLVSPTKDSLSAFGYVAFFQAKGDSAMIAAAILLCLINLFFIKLVRKKRLSVVFSSLQLVCVVIIIAHGFTGHKELMWGAWVLLGVIITIMITDALELKADAAEKERAESVLKRDTTRVVARARRPGKPSGRR